ncbi:fumarylacetoacetate hydrolase family protein [Microbacterium thalassium]|uniref:2-keto-4-pentenoate hydratase/2-oxohepta-3-ene-1,7-dioic acid hydratase in catechol pathway n=1 Tax=Microbacterium thalassium TaxID=362649 RepID=A0A7X0FNY6_9MICO|nr:fumarylacetoacetate hydrolase family protein [Microbacterium thalassium]MBB6390520.1 2-keto-4-pentenoate hydratase/2-oxohepta-3-ene-1,7-dioic acid hydratase in catechol pathway [Microbacterium thalassium]GLK25631.1 hydroxylase [Microbacterium thalassium]
MRIARWQRLDGVIESGFIHDDHAIPLPDGRPVDVLIHAGLPTALAVGRELIESRDRTGWRPLPTVRLVPPIVPGSIRDFVTFEEHVEGMVKRADPAATVSDAWYEAPTFYFTNPHTLIGPTDTLVPPRTAELDFELEVAAVIGAVRESDGRHMTVERSAQQIFGYTIFNDWSARDLQAREMKVSLGPCKGKDFGATLGPWIVTADEFTDRHTDDGLLDLDVEVEINGEIYGTDNLTGMSWSFPEMIAYASRDSRVAPGDILASGTAGRGCLAEIWGRTGSLDPAPLKPGDSVRITVEGIGEILNTIGEPRASLPEVPAARRNSGRLRAARQ